MLSVRYNFKNKYSVSKPNEVLMGSASEANNRGYVLANCPRPPPKPNQHTLTLSLGEGITKQLILRTKSL